MDKPVQMAQRIEVWPIQHLKPYERNARTHSPEQIAKLAASIAEFGFTNPVLVDGDAGIIAGHGRLEAARSLGMKEVPVIELTHLTDEQKRAYVIADNRLAEDAGWDQDLLAAELADLQAEGYDLGITGFTDEELGQILDGLEEGEDREDDSGPAGDGDGHDFGAPVIAYNLVFDTEAQQKRWYRFVRWLRTNMQGETIAERLDRYLDGLDLPE